MYGSVHGSRRSTNDSGVSIPKLIISDRNSAPQIAANWESALPIRVAHHRARAASTLLSADAQLLAPQLGRNFLDPAFRQLPQVEWPVLHADQPRDLEAQLLHHALHFAVLAFGQLHVHPGIQPQNTLQVGDDRSVLHAIDGDAGRELLQ